MSRHVLSIPLAVLALAGTALAEDATPDAELEGDAERGEAGYSEACSECHASPVRILRRVEGDDAEERAAWLHAFLPDHYAEDDQLRADIVAYLLSEVED